MIWYHPTASDHTLQAGSYAIIGARGFSGWPSVVAIRVNKFKTVEGKITLPDATKEAVKAMAPSRTLNNMAGALQPNSAPTGEKPKKH